MKRTIFSALLIAAIVVVGAVAQTNTPAVPNQSGNDTSVLANRILELEGRVADLERHLLTAEEALRAERGYVSIVDEPLIFNLNNQRMDRYLRLSLTARVNPAQADQTSSALRRLAPIIKSRLFAEFADMTLEDLRGRKNQEKLRSESRDLINSELQSGGYDLQVDEVLFEELNIQ